MMTNLNFIIIIYSFIQSQISLNSIFKVKYEETQDYLV